MVFILLLATEFPGQSSYVVSIVLVDLLISSFLPLIFLVRKNISIGDFLVMAMAGPLLFLFLSYFILPK